MHNSKKKVINVLNKNKKNLRNIFYYKILKFFIHVLPLTLIRLIIKSKRKIL